MVTSSSSSSSSCLPVMDLKRLTFSDQFLSSTRNKVLSRFGLGIILSFIVLSVVLCNFSFKGPLFNGFSGIGSSSGSNSSILSWPFSSTSSGVVNDTSSTVVDQLDYPVGVNGSLGGNVGSKSSNTKNGTQKLNDEGVFGGAKTDEGSVSSVNNSMVSFGAKTDQGNVWFLNNNTVSVGAKTDEGSVPLVNNNTVSVGAKTDEGSVPLVNNNTLSVGAGGNESRLENGHGEDVKNETVAGKEIMAGEGGTGGDDGDLGFQGIMEMNAKKSFYECDIYQGEWVRDDTKPYYPASSCPFIDKDFDCHLNGRPDSEYVKWRWQPYDCDIPRLNTTDFLERLRGKKLVFVGDSLNRNMWESLVCVLRHGVADKKRVYEISGRHEFKKKGFYAFLFEDYNCTIDFVSSPFLVKESTYKSKNGSVETLRLDLMDVTTSMYHDADVIIFNTGHWWTHEKTSRGEDYYQEGDYIHPRLKVLEAYTRALATWGRWVDKNIDQKRTHVIFRGYSVTHFRGGPWNSGGQCHKETEPIYNETYLAKYPTKMKILEHVMKDVKTPVTYLNISRLTDFRKDGHPSIYRPDYQTAKQQEVHAQDCSHWCLPGVPDTWNHLLYVSLLKIGLGS